MISTEYSVETTVLLPAQVHFSLRATASHKDADAISFFIIKRQLLAVGWLVGWVKI